MEPPLCIGITLTIFSNLGYTPVLMDKLIIKARGMMIKSGIRDSSLTGILEGPVDLFSKELITSRISSLEICATIKLKLLRFFRNSLGDFSGTLGIEASVLGPTFTKNH